MLCAIPFSNCVRCRDFISAIALDRSSVVYDLTVLAQISFTLSLTPKQKGSPRSYLCCFSFYSVTRFVILTQCRVCSSKCLLEACCFDFSFAQPKHLIPLNVLLGLRCGAPNFISLIYNLGWQKARDLFYPEPRSNST